MTIQTFQQTLITAGAAGPALVNSNTTTSILPTPCIITLPANYFSYVGQQLRFRANGIISTVGNATQTLAFSIQFGTLGSPINAFAPGGTNMNAAAVTNQNWRLEIDLVCRSIGSGTAATMLGQGVFTSRATIGQPVVATQAGVGAALLPDTSPAVGAGFDSTITNVVNLMATWSTASASNSITLNQYSLESIL